MNRIKFAVSLIILFILSLNGISQLVRHYHIPDPYGGLLALVPLVASYVLGISYKIIPEQKFQKYKFKDKPYARLRDSKIKHEGVWKDAVIYVCLYENQEGMIWARFREDFYTNFIASGDEVDTETVVNLILSTNLHRQ